MHSPAKAFLVISAASLLAWAVHASGLAPVAVADSMTVIRGRQATVLNSGQASVLANDTDAERDRLTAELTRAPTRGTLALRSDGTFTYTHNGSAQTTDEFRYRAFDGTRRSAEVRVTIAIKPVPVAPVITGQKTLTTPEDKSLTVTLQDLVVTDSDSAYPGSFTLILRDGAADNYSLQGSAVVPDPNFNGTLTVPTRVNDGQADSNEFALKITVQAANDAPSVKQAIPDQIASEGEPFALNVAPSFGDVDAGDTLTFTAAGLPPSGSLKLSTAGALTGTPLSIDAQVLQYRVTITARDRAGASAATDFMLRMLPRRADLGISITALPDPATVSTPPEWTIEATNGSTSTSEATTLAAVWRSGGPALTLTTASSCTIVGNGTEVIELSCAIGALAPGAKSAVLVRSDQQAPGDQAVHASLALADANPANNQAFKSLNVAGTLSQDAAQRLTAVGADLVAGDLDGDARPDLVAVGDRTSVYFNTGAQTLDTTASTPPGTSSGDLVALIDWNRDTRLDVVTLSQSGGAGRVFLGDGARHFASGTPLPAIAARAAAAVDVTLDGQDELVVVGPNGTAQLSAGASPRTLDSRAASALAVADLDGDGRRDVAIALDGGGVGVIASTAGTPAMFVAGAGFGRVINVAANDVSGDGLADLLLAVDSTAGDSPENVVLRNERNGTYTETLRFGATKTLQLLAADVDGDKTNDVVAINATGVHQIYLGGSPTALTLQPDFLLSPGTATADAADFDGDGLPDLFVGGVTAPNVVVLRNSGNGRFGRGDVTPPVITLVGESTVAIKASTAYVDAGATAKDDVSGDLTSSIVVKNPVNTAIIGTYQISYDVKDRAGNAATTALRTVKVEATQGEGGGGGGAIDRYLLALVVLLVGLLWARRRSASAAARVKRETP
jgi:VCBS repeat-containing protein